MFICYLSYSYLMFLNYKFIVKIGIDQALNYTKLQVVENQLFTNRLSSVFQLRPNRTAFEARLACKRGSISTQKRPDQDMIEPLLECCSKLLVYNKIVNYS